MAKHYTTASSGPLRFMGQEFDGRDALAKEYPRFAGDDAYRAIRAGCETPFDVEVFCFNHRNRKRPKVPKADAQSEYRAGGDTKRAEKNAAQRRKAA